MLGLHKGRGHLFEIVEHSLRSAVLWDEGQDRLNEDALGLSLGQQQRLCIARTIAVKPEVILMDEPCSALDPIATLQIEELIQSLKKEYSIVIVTHNMQQASRASDFTGLFWLGELVEFDVTESVFTRPSQKLTEDYITGRADKPVPDLKVHRLPGAGSIHILRGEFFMRRRDTVQPEEKPDVEKRLGK